MLDKPPYTFLFFSATFIPIFPVTMRLNFDNLRPYDASKDREKSVGSSGVIGDGVYARKYGHIRILKSV
jgi:hypothetical protein